MALAAGAHLGPYEILAPLGAGGMGEVYKARDTRLGRIVAIKVLLSSASTSIEARARLAREARTLSQLSDPHICALFDIGSHEGIDFLVMELLDGETLAERLRRGPLPLHQVLRYGIDIAKALERAHRGGISHRDLKPANVMITPAGVKVLDFGLGKSSAPFDDIGGTASTIGGITMDGTIVGTLQYMAPEQLEGRPADARSDIFSLGAVLFEMATGRPPFTGGSAAAIASSIMSAEPASLRTLQPAAPAALERIVATCLAKDPEHRWRASHDVALQLASILDAPAQGDSPQTPARLAFFRWLPWAVALGGLALAAVLGVTSSRGARVAALPVRFTVPPPGGGAFLITVETVSIALSPDGSRLAFVGSGAAADDEGEVWIRSLDALEARGVPGTEHASSVFWSPDGRSIAFFADGKLKRLDLSGGAPVTICDVRQNIGQFGSWGAGGQILFASVQGESIMRVSISGGTPVEAVRRDTARGVSRVTWPVFLPDGQQFLFVERHDDDSKHLMLSRLDGPAREILTVTSLAQYVDPGYLLTVADGTLVAQRFDASTGRTAGEPFAIAQPVSLFTPTGAALFSASRNGVIAYQSHEDRAQMTWVGRDGRASATVGEVGRLQDLRLTPDGHRVVFDRTQPGLSYDVWTADLDRGLETRVTSWPGSESSPIWLPGGNAVVYGKAAGGPPRLMRRDLLTGSEEPLLPKSLGLQEAMDVSPDGRWLLYAQRTERGNYDLLTLRLSGPPTSAPAPALNSAFDEFHARFSPDGRAIAFTSDETGRREVYVAPFPEMAPKTRISAGGAYRPRWSRDGRELFYGDGAGHIMSVGITTTPAIRVGAPAPLLSMTPNLPWLDFDVAPDGRFLALVPVSFARQQPLTVIVNWAGQGRQ